VVAVAVEPPPRTPDPVGVEDELVDADPALGTEEDPVDCPIVEEEPTPRLDVGDGDKVVGVVSEGAVTEMSVTLGGITVVMVGGVITIA
jgi:hypothetical protein